MCQTTAEAFDEKIAKVGNDFNQKYQAELLGMKHPSRCYSQTGLDPVGERLMGQSRLWCLSQISKANFQTSHKYRDSPIWLRTLALAEFAGPGFSLS